MLYSSNYRSREQYGIPGIPGLGTTMMCQKACVFPGIPGIPGLGNTMVGQKPCVFQVFQVFQVWVTTMVGQNTRGKNVVSMCRGHYSSQRDKNVVSMCMP